MQAYKVFYSDKPIVELLSKVDFVIETNACSIIVNKELEFFYQRVDLTSR